MDLKRVLLAPAVEKIRNCKTNISHFITNFLQILEEKFDSRKIKFDVIEKFTHIFKYFK